MWLERSVMFPALHSTIRDVLDSNEATKVQFILEPLAFPLLFHCFKIHGQKFIEQLSYLIRTIAFSIDKEYRKILKIAKESPPPLSQPAYNVNTKLVGASLSEFDLLPLFKQKRPKTIQNGAFSEYSYFRMFLDVFF